MKCTSNNLPKIDALVAAKAQSPEMEKVMKAVLKRESNYGQNPAAYVANKAGGVIGEVGRIEANVTTTT